MSSISRNLLIATSSAVLAWVVAAHAQTISPLKTGQLELSQKGEVLKVPAWREGCQLMAAGPGRWMLGLVYGTPQRDENRVDVRFALGGLKGPGTYGKKNIDNLVVERDVDVWNFDPVKHDCTFTIGRLDPKGVEGSVTCAGTDIPFTSMKFVAAP